LNLKATCKDPHAMKLVYYFSFFLIMGISISQIVTLSEEAHFYLTFLSDTALAYILMEVGLELILNKKHGERYLWDYLVASTAAALPWIFCFAYLMLRTDQPWAETLLISRFAAPTATGILFSMLASLGIGGTWFFRKLQILVIFDDIDTILLMIPIQMLLLGINSTMYWILGIIILLVILAWKFLHRLRLPSNRVWLLGYALFLTAFLHSLQHVNVDIEIILPAFVWGALLFNPHTYKYTHEHRFLEPGKKPYFIFDRCIKFAFMFLVGLLLPKLKVDATNALSLCVDVLAITLLSNIGKCFPMLCYRGEASWRERVALGISMFPRGEVGAGILILAIKKGLDGYALSIAGFSIALNLLLSGVFIRIVTGLIRRPSLKGRGN
jgi:Kef-type K+ transport system membrane component KefB